MRARVRVVQPSAATGHALGKSLMFIGVLGLAGARRPRREGASVEAFEVAVSADPSGIPGARRRVREWLLRGCGAGEGLAGELELVASELVTNSIRYSAADPVVLSGRRSGGVVRLEVRDGCPSVPSGGVPDLLATRGRGLMLVDAVVRELGGSWAFTEGVGVWVEIPVTATASDVDSREGEAR